MKTKNLALSGVAALALLVAVPGFAQVAPPPGTSSQDNGLYGSQVNPPQVSSPAEKKETNQLNAQGVDGTTQSPAVLNGEAPAPNAPTNAAVQTPPPAPPAAGSPQASNATSFLQVAQNDPQQQYQDQQQQYQQQQQQYQDKQQQYDEQKHVYDRNVRQYDQERWNYVDYPHAYAYRYEDSPQMMRLYLVAEPAQQMANAPVEGPSGMWVGKIRNIETGVDGRPARVEISLNRRVSVWVHPGDLRFDPDDHIVFTDLTRDQLWDMPGATIESGGPY
jgi:hypothetical protein